MGDDGPLHTVPPVQDLRLYAVTDPSCNSKWGRSNAEAVQLAIEGGTTIVQLREKNADGAHFMQQANDVLQVTRPCGVSPEGCFPAG